MIITGKTFNCYSCTRAAIHPPCLQGGLLAGMTKVASNLRTDSEGVRKLVAARELIEQGELYQALDMLDALVKHAMREDDKILLFNTRQEMAKIYLQLDDVDKSIKNYQHCMAIARELKSTFDVAKILHNLASIYVSSNKDLNEALDLYSRSARLYEGIGDFQGAGQSTSDAAALYIKNGKLGKALKNLELALKLLERAEPGRLKDNSLALAHSRMAVLYLKRNEQPRALGFFEKSLAEFKEAENKVGIVSCLKSLVDLSINRDSERFSRYLVELKSFFEKEGDTDSLEELELKYRQFPN